MSTDAMPLSEVFEGWEGYQHSLVEAVRPLTPDQLAWRPAPHLRSVGELVGHIGQGRLTIFARIQSPRNAEFSDQAGAESLAETLNGNAPALVRKLESSWGMIEAALTEWSVADLATTDRYSDNGQTFALSRQWNIWLLLNHDLHHGGELALMLGIQGISAPLLGDRFGHLVNPPLAD